MFDDTEQELTEMIAEIFFKYDKGYSQRGISANLQAHLKNKDALIKLLRKHPNWDEEARAIIFDVAETRDIDAKIVEALKAELAVLAHGVEMTGEEYLTFTKCLYALNSEGAEKTLDRESEIQTLKAHGIKCAKGQKTSRVINAICVKYGVDKCKGYNALFAKLADALNPHCVKRKALLSVHPCDYLEMSNKDNSWRSCHCLDNGEYLAGTLSYMNDGVSMVFYTIDEDAEKPYSAAPKRTRQIFCYAGGALLQSRLYPNTHDNQTRDVYRHIVQNAIADCHETANVWTPVENWEGICQTHPSALHYTDYHFKEYMPNISKLDHGYTGYATFIIGHPVYCLECADEVHSADSLLCDVCVGVTTCVRCDNQVDIEDAYNIDGQWYCGDCVEQCEPCGEVFVMGQLTTAAAITLISTMPSRTLRAGVSAKNAPNFI
jgi:hypothetical protein